MTCKWLDAQGYSGEMSLQTCLVLILFPNHLLFAGVKSRPLVSPICLFLCASVSGGEFASRNISVL